MLRIRGIIGPLLRISLGNVHYRAVPCQTTITGALSEAALHKLLTRLDESGLEVVHLQRFPLRADTLTPAG
ncbi:hypothetical protein [Actinoplanes sp. TBRC 11911]|uniref:hypothetical protein n=1 Tax=Actinoplanes sp. TBRC 11911 TaxID=2729386 RepID=UPI00289C06AC|nr:hypothetical protein [Actinoplanes sp. TBRC 11911]